MQLARVVGTTTSTIKHPTMNGWKLLVVQMLQADGRSPDGDPVISIDSLGAAVGRTQRGAGPGGHASHAGRTEELTQRAEM
mgnify:CR=1 FL=1